ncbi:MAG: hypothetical protein KAG37_03045 [Flavobacteriales bacterium]|nr:hypothetical protein [Flavobacteriales bacterium]
MAKYKVSINIESQVPAKVQKLGNLIQGAVNKVSEDDIIKLLEKVNSNPNIVKTALSYL